MIHSIEYWKGYNESSISNISNIVYNTNFIETLNWALFEWNQETDDPIYNLPIDMINEAYEFHKEVGGSTINIIKAMICQLC